MSAIDGLLIGVIVVGVLLIIAVAVYIFSIWDAKSAKKLVALQRALNSQRDKPAPTFLSNESEDADEKHGFLLQPKRKASIKHGHTQSLPHKHSAGGLERWSGGGSPTPNDEHNDEDIVDMLVSKGNLKEDAESKYTTFENPLFSVDNNNVNQSGNKSAKTSPTRSRSSFKRTPNKKKLLPRIQHGTISCCSTRLVRGRFPISRNTVHRSTSVGAVVQWQPTGRWRFITRAQEQCSTVELDRLNHPPTRRSPKWQGQVCALPRLTTLSSWSHRYLRSWLTPSMGSKPRGGHLHHTQPRQRSLQNTTACRSSR